MSTPQIFPDQPYLDRIRAALWRPGAHGNAAVMVGAGMSLNARPRGAGTGRFPSWSDLARTVVDHLYPAHGGTDSRHRSHALQQANATSGFLRLAQEYETAFGREALERLIADSVPDLRFEPGDLHDRLLKLPWSDVFTTNWDTLLERAATRVVDRHYDVVRTAADIPASVRPRIVKLHGTLPATRPFIFTEEDFRTYPTRFAPFVNLAQQSMMESVFCLLGFSGDDPNFLYWSGWVRDHLKDYAPRIYLVGWLDLPPPRRRMLEDRGVVPVDLAHLPLPVVWPEESRHQRALEWFLWSLEKAEPYKATNWPEAQDLRQPESPAYLPPILVDDSGFPKRENSGPERSPEIEELRNTVKVWQHNRRLYPGWIVAPRFTQSDVWGSTRGWIPAILELLPALAPVERLEALEELNWRLETALVPLRAELIEAISDVLSEIDPLAPSIPNPNHIDDQSPRHRWVRLASALLRAARETDDDAAFERWAEALSPHEPDHTWLGPRIAYERCLLSLAQLDHTAVERALDDLDADTDEVFWKVRKAGILAELGKIHESFRLTGEALSEIRQQLGHGAADIPTLSREGWAMFMAQGLSSYPHPRGPIWEIGSQPAGQRGIEPHERAARRWEILRHYGCDAREEHYEAWRAVEKEPPGREPEVVETLGFDPWHRTRIGRGERWSTNQGWEHLPGFQAKRLVEEIGLPTIVDYHDLAKSLLLRTAVWLAEIAPSSALGSILRASDYEKDEVFDSFFNRSRIALLAEPHVNTLVGRIIRALSYGMPKAVAARTEEDHERSAHWVSRTRVAVELLSRLVLRLGGDQAERVLDRALEFYRTPLFREHHWLIEPLKHLFSRTLTALDPERLLAHLAQFLALPLPQEGEFDVDSPRNWPDPFRLAAKSFGTLSPELEITPEWSQSVDNLIELVASTPQPYPRWLAIDRLDVLLRWGVLTKENIARLGEAIWRHRLPGDGFPEGPWPSLHLNYVFLFLPSPEAELAEQLFRRQYLTASEAPTLAWLSYDFFQNLLGAVEGQPPGCEGLTLSPVEIEQALERILAAWRSGELRQSLVNRSAWGNPFDFERYRTAFAQTLGRVILPRLNLGSTHKSEVVQLIDVLRTSEFPVEAIYPALARLLPDVLLEVSDWLRQRLASPRREQTEAAVEAVWWWLREGCQFDLGEPPADLVREIAIAVSMRRPSLQLALRAAEWILQNNALAEADRNRFARLIAEGLGYLLSEARYTAGLTRQPVPGFKPNEITEVRILCVEVASALERAGFGDLPAVGEWIREGWADPFPEVRRALGARETARQDAEAGTGGSPPESL